MKKNPYVVPALVVVLTFAALAKALSEIDPADSVAGNYLIGFALCVAVSNGLRMLDAFRMGLEIKAIKNAKGDAVYNRAEIILARKHEAEAAVERDIYKILAVKWMNIARYIVGGTGLPKCSNGKDYDHLVSYSEHLEGQVKMVYNGLDRDTD